MNYEVKRFETVVTIKEMLEKYYDYGRTLVKCRACPGFATTWSCPEFDFHPDDYWNQFSRLHLIVDRISNEGLLSPKDAQERLMAEKSLYNADMLSKEKELPGSKALAAQECGHCKICARLADRPCVHPELMRYALESLGMIAVNLVRDQFGFEILWSDGVSTPEYYLLVGGILEK